MPEESHELHCLVRELVIDAKPADCEALFDSACLRGGEGAMEQHLPLFAKDNRLNSEVYCNVDALILRDGKVAVIVEIEESGLLPTKVCGKFLTSALSTTHIHGKKDVPPIRFADRVLFIQVLRIPEDFPRERSNLTEKWDNLEHSINSNLPLRNSRIVEYRLLYGTLGEFGGERREALMKTIKAFLGRQSS